MLTFHGDVWARIFTDQAAAQGTIEVGIRRRLTSPPARAGSGWHSRSCPSAAGIGEKIPYRLELAEGAVDPGEPVDVYLRWLPGFGPAEDLLVDRSSFIRTMRLVFLTPEVVSLARAAGSAAALAGRELRQCL